MDPVFFQRLSSAFRQVGAERLRCVLCPAVWPGEMITGHAKEGGGATTSGSPLHTSPQVCLAKLVQYLFLYVLSLFFFRRRLRPTADIGAGRLRRTTRRRVTPRGWAPFGGV